MNHSIPAMQPPRELASLSCVVPCYNEARNLEQLLPLLRAKLASLAPRWEIVLVDDGSTDATAERMREWTREPGVRAVILSRNFGKEAALSAGLEAAAGDAVVMMDSDMQHPPALLDTFVRHWRAGADVVYAVREHREAESAFKRVGTDWFYGLINGGERFRLPPGAGDFRLMDRKVVQALLALPERNRFMKGLYAWVGFKAAALPFVPHDRAGGQTSFSMRRLGSLALLGLTSFTTLPLRVWSVVGSLVALLALVYGAWITLDTILHGTDLQGWPTLAAGIMLFSGVQLMSIGILGEYIGRIYEEVKRRPTYLVARDEDNSPWRDS